MTNPKAAESRVKFDMVERKRGDLWVDPRVQRGLKKHRIATMAKEFNPDALGVITTSYRSPRRIHVVDGQHRYRTIEAVAYDGPFMTMEYHGLTIQEEAALFRLLNKSEKVSRIDQFLVACVEEDPKAVELNAIMELNGWTVSQYSAEGRLTAIGNLERVYDLGADVAKSTLAVLTAAYGHRPSAVQGSMLLGVGRMLARYGENVDLDDLAQRLAKIPGGPDGLVGNARGQSLTRTGDLSTQVARIMVNVYNQRRRTTALAPWE